MRASGCASSRRTATISARAAIVAVPPGVIANETLRFSPALPDKLEAAHALPLGVADKVFLSVDGADDLPVETRLFGATERARPAATRCARSAVR